MDDDARTLYCGNLSDEVTEDILYELFLQGGPVQKISIPKDRDGKQRTYAFITYKHIHSVNYALRLFEGTMLYNRLLSMKPRNCTDSQQQGEKCFYQAQHINHMMLQLGQQMILGNGSQWFNGGVFNVNMSQNTSPYPNQPDVNSGNDDRNFKRTYPYQRERDRNRDRERVRDRDRDRERDRNRDRDRDRDRDKERNRDRNHDDHYRDERLYHNRDNYRSNDYPRFNDNRKRWTYH